MVIFLCLRLLSPQIHLSSLTNTYNRFNNFAFDKDNEAFMSLVVLHSNTSINFGKYVHMGQFLQGGKNGRLMSFFLKVEPPCDQT